MLLHTFTLLAEASGFSGSDIAPALSTLGSLGISIWYVYHTTTVSIPRMQADHKAEREQMQERWDKQSDEQRADFSATIQSLLVEMKEQRSQFAEWMRSRLQG